MKKYLPLSLTLLVVFACTLSFPDKSFNEKASTQVAVALTATALDREINQKPAAINTSAPEKEPSPVVEDTPIPSEDPTQDLGSPTWSDDLSTGSYWGLDQVSKTIDSTSTTFSIMDGKLSAKSAAIGDGNVYWLTHLSFQNAYLEGKFDITNCTNDDQYGLVVRAPDFESKFGYYFHVTCDGHYDLRRWTQSGSAMMLGMPASEKINTGSNKTNILGIWVENNIIRLYVNDHLLEEIDDSTLNNIGHFGLFINARKTPDFTINLDEIRYWLQE